MEKQQVDKIITGGSIITSNHENENIESGAIAVQGTDIVAIGTSEEIATGYDAAETIDATGHVVMPGLIDTHFHTAQQFERNLMAYLNRETNLRDPIWQYALIPFEASLSDEDIHLSALLGYANMIKVGTTCFADPGGPRPENMAPAIEQVGLRGVLARSTLDEIENIPIEMRDTIEGIVDKGESFFKEWNGKADGRVRTWMGMREIMVCSPEAIKAIKQTADKLGTGIHIHLAEHASEVDYAIMKSGLRPAFYLESLGFLESNVIAAHSALLSQSELDLYKEYDIAVAHCPAIAFSFCGPTKVPEMLERDLRIGIGTDGAFSSGGSLDLFRQMAITRYAQTALFGLPYHEDLAFIDDRALLKMATLGGAEALMWDDEIGSLEVGKKADILLLSIGELDSLPFYDPINWAASVAHGSNVNTVLVNGEIVMRDRKLTRVDEEELMEKVKERTPLILNRFLERVDNS
ncbi:MAG: amidohydrolase [Chloroflexi bacterium]|nr:MAG: amidohydrolase [Chloroflexota bacterium]MBL1196701.1 amidohydrolase [Chloroflexota bacterium]NOH13994.1 amidohydrolase [Chloroflexota bacterium]